MKLETNQNLKLRKSKKRCTYKLKKAQRRLFQCWSLHNVRLEMARIAPTSIKRIKCRKNKIEKLAKN